MLGFIRKKRGFSPTYGRTGADRRQRSGTFRARHRGARCRLGWAHV